MQAEAGPEAELRSSTHKILGFKAVLKVEESGLEGFEFEVYRRSV